MPSTQFQGGVGTTPFDVEQASMRRVSGFEGGILAERPAPFAMLLVVRHAAERPPAAPRPQPQPPPALTEAEQRTALAERNQEREAADAASLQAADAMQRGQQHVEACATALAGFGDLDDAITDATIAAFWSSEGRPRVEMIKTYLFDISK
jgi:hypothetical protein